MIKLSWILQIFWPLLRNRCSMEYHGNHYFTDIRIGVLHHEGLMSHTLLNLTTCYIKTCYFRHIMQTVPILSKWVGDPSFWELKYSVT